MIFEQTRITQPTVSKTSERNVSFGLKRIRALICAFTEPSLRENSLFEHA
jgi:hypothetical protein